MRLFRRRTSDAAPDPQLTRFAAPDDGQAEDTKSCDNSDALSTVACQSAVSSPGVTKKGTAAAGGGGELFVAV